MTILLIYLTAPQVFTFMWTRASWNLEWMSVQKTFQKSRHFLLLSLRVPEIHGHLFCGVSGLYHYFLLFLNLPESLKYMVIFFSGVWGLYCHFFLYLDLLLFFTSFCLFVFMFKTQDCRRTVLKTLFWEHPCPISTGILDIFSFTLITICMTS